MFDPNKYDNTNSTESNNSKNRLDEFIEKREKIIKYLKDIKPIILAECKSLDKQVEKNPESDGAKAFKKKLDGWSRILNGTDIVVKMYEVV